MVLNCGTNSTALCVKCLCIHADRIRTFVACLVTHRPRLSCSFLVLCSFSLSVYMFVFSLCLATVSRGPLGHLPVPHPHHPVSERNFWYYCSCIVSCTHRVIFISHTSLSPHLTPSPQHTLTSFTSSHHSPYHLTPHPKITHHTTTHPITHSLNTPVHERYNICYPLCHILPIVPRQHIVTPPKIIYT